MNRKRVFRRTGTGRRMISFLFAFMWLFSASGINAFAQNDNNIYYSDPVTAPVRTAETPLPEENAEETPGIPAAGEIAEEPESLPDGEAGQTETGMSEEAAVQDENGELPEEYTGDDGNAVQEERPMGEINPEYSNLTCWRW